MTWLVSVDAWSAICSSLGVIRGSMVVDVIEYFSGLSLSIVIVLVLLADCHMEINTPDSKTVSWFGDVPSLNSFIARVS
jgi:hypothetical protein